MPRALLLALFLPLSCYQPGYTGPYACKPETAVEDCPDGWQCVTERCMPPGDAGVTQDLAFVPPDLTSPPDAQGRPACIQGGLLVQLLQLGEVWACDGTFAPGNYESLCDGNSGYHVCGQSSRDGALLPSLLCDQIAGFYVVRADITVVHEIVDMKYFGHCGLPSPEEKHTVLGCGTAPFTVKLDGEGCLGLNTALLCPAGGDWSCSSRLGLMDVAHQGGSGGTLCCKNKK